ncbi:MAG: hypothetical protein JXR95_09840 [Deltaproteobacteria bacterium]|nr:hypothetical protein [Deltaproteobacteria bacterium]
MKFYILPVLFLALQGCNFVLDIKDPPPSCGDNKIDDSEECDGIVPDGFSCSNSGFQFGTISCTQNCTIDYSLCSNISPDCGNGIVDEGETCDGTPGDDLSCESYGYPSGVLECTENCTININGCAGALCGNGMKDSTEACDDNDFGSISCESLGFLGGNLICENNCSVINSDNCIEASSCGDNVIDEHEECDSTNTGGTSCESIGFYDGGNIGCNENCTLDVSGCLGGYCGDGILQGDYEICDGMIPDTDCNELGFWSGSPVCTDCDIDSSTCAVPVFVSNGYSHTCAITSSGATYCWGLNTMGQLGTGTMNKSDPSLGYSLIPLFVQLSSPLIKLSSSYYTSCGILEDGRMSCWGDGNPTPHIIPGYSNLVDLCTGQSHICGLDANGSLKCHGNNYYGQLGIGTSGDSFNTPQDVSSIENVVSVSCGAHHTCAIDSNDNLFCWGRGTDGRIGNHSLMNTVYPDLIMSNAKNLSCGQKHTCAVDLDNNAWCWGDNYYGQIGNGSSGTDVLTPYETTSHGFVTRAFANDASTCTTGIFGGMSCWGRNYYGELGDGTFDAEYQGTVVNEISGYFSSISANGHHVCVIDSSDKLYCWGSNAYGKLGNGETLNSNIPVEVISPQ